MLLYLGDDGSEKEEENDKSVKPRSLCAWGKKMLQRKNHYHKMDIDENQKNNLSKN